MLFKTVFPLKMLTPTAVLLSRRWANLSEASVIKETQTLTIQAQPKSMSWTNKHCGVDSKRLDPLRCGCGSYRFEREGANKHCGVANKRRSRIGSATVQQQVWLPATLGSPNRTLDFERLTSEKGPSFVGVAIRLPLVRNIDFLLDAVKR